MKREFDAVQSMLVKGVDRVKLNQTWRKVHEQRGVGTVVANMLILTQGERDHLRSWIKKETGIDPFGHEKLPERRIDAAARGKNEKVARRNVFSDMLRVARIGGGNIITRSGNALVPPFSVLEVNADQLILCNETVIIVENGELIREWHRIRLPSEIESALIIYRGHESEAALLRELLRSEPPKLNVGYYDFDPAGLLMGLSNEHQAVLLPQGLSELRPGQKLFEAINQPNKFWEQGKQLQSLQKKGNSILQPYIDLLELHQVAIMQEHHITKELTLDLVYLQPQSGG